MNVKEEKKSSFLFDITDYLMVAAFLGATLSFSSFFYSTFEMPKYVAGSFFVTLAIITELAGRFHAGAFRNNQVSTFEREVVHSLLLLAGAMGISSIVARSFYLSAVEFFRLFFPAAFFFLLLSGGMKRVSAVLGWLPPVAFAAGAAAVLQNFGYGLVLDFSDPVFHSLDARCRIVSLYGNPNFAAPFLAASALYLLIIFIDEIYQQFPLFTISAICKFIASIAAFSGLIMTQTRSSWIAFTVAFLWYSKSFFLSSSGRKKVLTAVFLLAVILLAIQVIDVPGTGHFRFFERAGSIFDPSERNIRQRIMIWKSTMEMFRDSWLTGVGPGNYGLLYPYYQARFFEKSGKKYEDVAAHPLRAHNEYLHILAENGLSGGLAFIYFLFTLFSSEKSDSVERRLFRAVLLLFTVDSIFNFPLRINGPVHFFWLASAGVILLHPDNRDSSRVNRSFISLLMLLVLSLAGFYHISNLAACDVAIKKALEYEVKGEEDESIKLLKFALGKNPASAEAAYLLGEMLEKRGDTAHARDIYEQALGYTGSRKIMFNLASAYLTLGRSNEARDILIATVRAFPNYSRARYNLGVLYYNEGLKDRAEVQFIEALRYDGRFIPPRFNLYVLARERGDLKRARKMLEEILAMEPDNFPARSELQKLEAEAAGK